MSGLDTRPWFMSDGEGVEAEYDDVLQIAD